MTTPKNTIQIFPAEVSDFDRAIVEYVQHIIGVEVERSEKPTLKAIAANLEIDPQRLTRILKAIGLWDLYREERKRAFKKYRHGAAPK